MFQHLARLHSAHRFLPWLNRADRRTPKIKVNPTQSRELMEHPVLRLLIVHVFTLAGARGDGRIEYEDSTSQHYCPYTPFRMAFVYLIIYWVFFFLSCCAPCWMGLGGCGKKKSNVVVVVNDIPDPHDVVSLPTVSKRVDAQSPPRYNDLIF